jgi:SAM-dependent methyltransferase
MSANPTPSVVRSARRWFGERVSRLGFAQASSEFIHEMWEFLRDSTPERKRQRYGDVDYDWEHRVDTTSATVGWRDRLLGVFHSPYMPTEPVIFREMIEGLGLDYARLTFIDLGSGKGRALLMASEYPFRRIIGVEILPELHRVASENVEKFAKRQGRPIEPICGDAREFVFPPEPLLLYLFNPLPEAGLKRVMENLERSVAESPREIWVVYHNPLLEQVLAGSGRLRKAGGTAQYVVYGSDATNGVELVSK